MHITALQDKFWQQDLAFLTDITGHLNDLNLKKARQKSIDNQYVPLTKSICSEVHIF